MSVKFLTSFKGYKSKYLSNDLVAAVLVTAIAVPESLAFAAIIGLPLQAGLYCALLAPIIFALFTSSRRLVIGADSATASLIAAGAAAVAVVGTAEYVGSVALLGIITAITLLIMGVAKLGFLANFISRPVLIGFFAGVGVQLILGRLPEMVGIAATGNSLQRFVSLIGKLDEINIFALLVSVTVVGLSLIFRRSKFPGMLIGLIAATLLSISFSFSRYGIELVGKIPSGLPNFVLPEFDIQNVLILIPYSLSIALVIIAQSSSVSRSLAADHDEKTRTNQDIMALGFANLASSITQGFTVNGSPPRSTAASQAGGRSQMVNIFMALIIGAILLFATKIFLYVPVAALSAIVFVIGLHLIRIEDLKEIYATRRTEFFIALIALVGVVALDVRQGIFIAIIVALMERLHRQYTPGDQILLRDGVLSKWASERLNIDPRHSRQLDGILVYSFSGSLFFETSEYFSSRVKKAIAAAKKPVHYILIDAGAIDDIDYTAVNMLQRLAHRLNQDNIALGFVHVSPRLREQFDRFEILNTIGPENIYSTLKAAIEQYPQQNRDIFDMIKDLKLDKKSYVVISGGALEAYKLRPALGVDLVVSESVYRHFKDDKKWAEHTQDNGKLILTNNGYRLMRRWMGNDLSALQKDQIIINDTPVMSIEKLRECKEKLGRAKDLADLRLINKYIRKKSN